MEPIEFISSSEEETIAFGKKLVDQLRPGDIICLVGDLGTGKTTLVKGIAQALKVKEAKVHSPTFTLMNVYEGKVPLYHFDLYRLEDEKSIRSIEYDEYLYGNGISVIEWADRLGKAMPLAYIKVDLAHRKDGGRNIRLSLIGKRK